MEMAPQAGFEPATLRLTEQRRTSVGVSGGAFWVFVGFVFCRSSYGKLPCASVRFVPDPHAVSHCVSPDLCGGPARTHGDRAADSSQFWSTDFFAEHNRDRIATPVHQGRP